MASSPCTQYVEVMWPDRIAPGDLEIVQEATDDRPGKIKILKAIIRKPSGPSNGNLNSEDLVSAAGGKIGFVAPVSMLTEGPFNSSYYLIPSAPESRPETE